jgi:hypothetical protein
MPCNHQDENTSLLGIYNWRVLISIIQHSPESEGNMHIRTESQNRMKTQLGTLNFRGEHFTNSL